MGYAASKWDAVQHQSQAGFLCSAKCRLPVVFESLEKIICHFQSLESGKSEQNISFETSPIKLTKPVISSLTFGITS